KERPRDTLTVDSYIEVLTDILALSRHAGTVALKYNHYENPNAEIATKTKSLLERLSRVESLSDLEELLKEGQKHADTVIQPEIEIAKTRQKSKSRSPYEMTVEHWLTTLAAYQNTVIESKGKKGDDVAMIEVKTKNIADFEAG